jgi:hypothetical protein
MASSTSTSTLSRPGSSPFALLPSLMRPPRDHFDSFKWGQQRVDLPINLHEASV